MKKRTEKQKWDKKRLARQDQLRRDKERLPSVTTRIIGIEIFANSNMANGGSYHPEAMMAENLGVNVKSVKRALPELVNAGYIKIRKFGRSNFYEIVLFETGDLMSPVLTSEGLGRPISQRGPTTFPGKGDKNANDRGQIRPTIGDTRGPLTLNSNSKENSDGGDGYGEDARTRELLARILVEIGAKPNTPLILEAPSVLQSWLAKGWDEQCILMGISMGKRSLQRPPSTLRYFEKPIGRVVDELLRPAVPAIDLKTSPAPKAKVHAAPRPPPPRPDPKRGQYEIEIGTALGADVFDDLPAEAVEELCKRWPRGQVTMAEIEALKMQHAQARATGHPAAARRW